MIIDIKTDKHPKFRAMSLKGAIAAHLDLLEIDESIRIDTAINWDGKYITTSSILSASHGAAKVLGITIATKMINGDVIVMMVRK